MPTELTFPSESVRAWTLEVEPTLRADLAARGVAQPDADIILEQLRATWGRYACLLFPDAIRVPVPPIPTLTVLSAPEREALVQAVTAAVTATVRSVLRGHVDLIRQLLVERLSVETAQSIAVVRHATEPDDARRLLHLDPSPSPQA